MSFIIIVVYTSQTSRGRSLLSQLPAGFQKAAYGEPFERGVWKFSGILLVFLHSAFVQCFFQVKENQHYNQ